MQSKKLKKLLALTCVAAMLPASLASATTLGGDSSIENSSASDPTVVSVVLPTASADIYDFTVDRNGLLKAHGDSTMYDGTAKNVYFYAQKTAAKLAPATATNAFYVKEKTEVLTPSTTIPAKVSAGVTAFDTANYYVWQPDTSSAAAKAAGTGKWTKLSSENAANFLDLTITDGTGAITAVAVKTGNTSGANIFDGKIYEEGYTKITDDTVAAKYVTLTTNGTVDTISTDLFMSLADGSSSTYTNPAVSDVKYTAAVYQYTGTSDEAKIINKSSSPIAVAVVATAKVSDGKTDGLTYVGSSATLDGTADVAGIQIALGDGSDSTYFATSGDAATANAYYVLPAMTTATTTYQSTEINEATGSHVYYQYYAPAKDSDYSSAAFKLTAAASNSGLDHEGQGTANADDAKWDAYIADLTADNATVEKPEISVVYAWETVAATNATTFTATSGNTYTTTGGATGWITTATVDQSKMNATGAGSSAVEEDVAPSVTEVVYNKSAGGDAVITVDLGSGDLGARAITDVAIDWAGTWYSKSTSWGDETDTTYADDITISGNTITFNSTYTNDFSVGDEFEVYIVLDGDVDGALVTTITVE